MVRAPQRLTTVFIWLVAGVIKIRWPPRGLESLVNLGFSGDLYTKLRARADFRILDLEKISHSSNMRFVAMKNEFRYVKDMTPTHDLERLNTEQLRDKEFGAESVILYAPDLRLRPGR